MKKFCTAHSRGRLFRALLACLMFLSLNGCAWLRSGKPPLQQEPDRGPGPVVLPGAEGDRRPYEFIWDEREEEYEPFIDFENLIGWTADTFHEVQVVFDRSDEIQLWKKYVGRVEYTGHHPDGRFLLRPPEPMQIPDRFDTVTIWVYGQQADDSTDGYRPQLSILLVDSEGQSKRLELGSITWQGWSLVQCPVSRDDLQGLKHPYFFVGFEVGHAQSSSPAVFYLDSLAFFTELLPPLDVTPRPRPGAITFASGQTSGLHTGTNTLTFPVRVETILPPVSQPAASNTFARSEEQYTWSHPVEDQFLSYRFVPREGFEGFEVLWNGTVVARPFHGAGLLGGSDPSYEVTVLRDEQDNLRVQYKSGLTMEIGLRHNTLMIDLACRGGKIRGVDLGRMSGVHQPSVLAVPFLSRSTSGPTMGMLSVSQDRPDEKLFTSVLIDWYRSHASALSFDATADGTNLDVQGSMQYHPDTRGRYNDIFERILLTFSPRLDEVLPVIPHPPGRHMDQILDKLWMDPNLVDHVVGVHEQCCALKGYGVSQIIMCGWDDLWSKGDDSISLRTRTHPNHGGHQHISQGINALKDKGWLTGLYVNYREFSPLNKRWSTRLVQRLSDGRWRKADSLNYALKPSEAAGLQEALIPVLKRRYESSMVYLDGHTALPPWANTDYDARIPGAGTFAQAYYCYGELLDKESALSGLPVIGPGGCAWMYAGLLSGFLVDPQAQGIVAGTPFLPSFALQRLHALSVGFGAGTLEAFWGNESWREDSDAALSQYLATQIAYGLAGRIPDGEIKDIEQLCRAYFMMQQLQKQYGVHVPGQISYWDGERFQDVSQAVHSGNYLRSQLYLRYQEDLEIWVNGSPHKNWNVKVGKEQWILPPYGWVASAGSFFEVSAILGDGQIEYVESDDYIYYDGRGRGETYRGVACTESLVLRVSSTEHGSRLEVWDVGQSGDFGIGSIKGLDGNLFKVSAYDLHGEAVEDVAFELHADVNWVTGPERAVRYVMEYDVRVE